LRFFLDVRPSDR